MVSYHKEINSQKACPRYARLLKQGLWASRIPIEASMRAPSRRFDLPGEVKMGKKTFASPRT